MDEFFTAITADGGSNPDDIDAEMQSLQQEMDNQREDEMQNANIHTLTQLPRASNAPIPATRLPMASSQEYATTPLGNNASTGARQATRGNRFVL